MLLHIVDTLLITGSLPLEHIVNHVLDVSRSGLFFDFGLVLHDSVFELHTQLIFSKSFFIGIDVTSIVIMEDIVEGKRVKRSIEHLFHKTALCL